MNAMELFVVLLSCVSWTFASPLQQPLRSGKELDWASADCHSGTGGNGHKTICIQQVWDPVIDQDINGALVINQFCGYMNLTDDVIPVQLFFWVVMSETDPTKDPVVIWMNGGPGSSSLYGRLSQWGPSLIDYPSRPSVVFRTNPIRMAEKLTWVYLEQPSEVGYSAGRKNIDNSTTAAIDISTFINNLFLSSTVFKFNGGQLSLAGRELHVAGESYAGHWIPALGSYLVKKGKLGSINLKSFIVGNAWTDAALIGDSINKLLCGPTPLVLPDASPADIASNCSHMPQWINICTSALTKCRKKLVPCDQFGEKCFDSWGSGWAFKFKRNPYDVQKTRQDYIDTSEFLGKKFADFMNVPSRKDRFHVPQSITWKIANDDMRERFRLSGDYVRSYIPEVQDILNAGIDFFFYAGDQDLVCPFTLVKETALRTVWNEGDPLLVTKTAKFRKCAGRGESTYRKISSPSSPDYASYIRAGHLTYARIFGAGHMVNENKPAEAKHMFESWIFDRGLFQECDPGP